MKDKYRDDFNEVCQEVKYEIDKARNKYQRDFASTHEAYGVIFEELDELWDEIKKKQPDKDKMRHEAMQTASMLIRLIIELT